MVAHIEAHDGTGRAAGATDSDTSGHYSLTLAPGTYTLTASTGAVYPRCPTVTVTVTADAPTRADIACDSGIR